METQVNGNRTFHKNWVLRLLLAASIAAVCLNLSFYSVSLSDSLSHMGVYRELRLGMPRSEAMRILESHHLSCGWKYPMDARPRACDFLDFWREYKVSFSGGDDSRLVLKSFAHRRHNPSLGRLIRYFLHLRR